MDWGRAARWLAAVTIVGFALLGVWAMLEGEVPCEDGPVARNGTASCPRPDTSDDRKDWLVQPGS